MNLGFLLLDVLLLVCTSGMDYVHLRESLLMISDKGYKLSTVPHCGILHGNTCIIHEIILFVSIIP